MQVGNETLNFRESIISPGMVVVSTHDDNCRTCGGVGQVPRLVSINMMTYDWGPCPEIKRKLVPTLADPEE